MVCSRVSGAFCILSLLKPRTSDWSKLPRNTESASLRTIIKNIKSVDNKFLHNIYLNCPLRIMDKVM